MVENDNIEVNEEKDVEKMLFEGVSTPEKADSRLEWYCAPAFLLFWLVLFFSIVQPLLLQLPRGLTMESEQQHVGRFIAERAERILYEFDKIGPKVTGSNANENITMNLLKDEVEKIRRVMQDDLFDMVTDVQVVSGAYVRWPVLNMYQANQNFIVKLSSKNSTSENYLLINSHFDSKPGSSGAGDDGVMVVVMLEILRVLATNRVAFKHPIVFLFNGAEENSLQASHGFITQHKWARYCKALINLDSAGSGNREIVFQSGPNHPWLMKYYSKHAVRPFATTVAEELFQTNIILSDTDFRIFRDYGHVPGLDFAHFYNGYVYHTEFDKSDIIPLGTLQATGDNILSLAKAFANAPELADTAKYSEGHSVFYDFLGIFFIYYTETQGKIINTCVSVIAIIAVGVSIRNMDDMSLISISKILKVYAWLLILHLVGIALALLLPLSVAVIFDSTDRSMTWFASKWLVFGLYMCPSLFGLSLPSVLYLSRNENDKLKKSFKIQLLQHAHAFTLAVICVLGTYNGLRSSYIFLVPLLFYVAASLINLITTLYRRDNYWCIFIILSQIVPFIYTTYLLLLSLIVLIPMMGGSGSTTNPDLLISTICALGSILSLGFVMPLWNMFRRPKMLLSLLLLIAFIFAIIATTPIGFPYRAKTHVARVHYMNVRRVFYEYDGSVSLNESGYYFDLQDRRLHHSKPNNINLRDAKNLSYDCSHYMMCGLPLFNRLMVKRSSEGIWLPSEVPTELPGIPKLVVLNKTYNARNNITRFEFELSGPPHMSIFLLPLEGAALLDWSFLKPVLQEPQKYPPPYHIYFTYGKLSTPLLFHFDFKLTNSSGGQPLFELGISGHYISSEYPRGKHDQQFMEQFQDYVFVMEWSSSYERFIF